MATVLTLRRPAEDILHARYEKSATALLAVAQILEHDQPLNGGESEFLDLVQHVQNAEPEAFTQVWRDPFAYWWSRLAYQLLAAHFREGERSPFLEAYCRAIGEDETDRALRWHLDDFRRIASGVAIVQGQNLTLDQPLVRRAPIAIPGTRLSTAGTADVALSGVKAGRLVMPDLQAAAVDECPVVIAAGLEWRLQPAAFQLPGLGFEMPPEALDLHFQAGLADTTTEAFEIIARMRPELQPAFESVARTIGFKPLDSADYTNLTHSELPGAFMCSQALDPYDLADTLIHEFHHNLLYAIEEDSPFFEPGTEAVVDYYSPWRSDVRDLHGILHVVYVYIAASWFWLAVRESGELSGLQADYCTDRLVRYPLQLAIGEAVLEDRSQFTDHGAALFAEIKAARLEIDAAVAKAGMAFDAPAISSDDQGVIEAVMGRNGEPMTVRGSVGTHLEENDTTGTGLKAVKSHSITV